MGVTGVAISMGHLILMVFTSVLKRYHGMEIWVALGFAPGVAGIHLITTERRE